MEKKVERICATLTETIKEWHGVSAVTLGEAARIDSIDPYFRIDLDVYHRDGLPSRNERGTGLGNPAGFEAAVGQHADRFLVDDLPVWIAYKAVDRIDHLLDRVMKGRWAFRGETTNMLYRIDHGAVLYQRDNWFSDAASRLKEVPEEFWTRLKEASRRALDRYLNEIGAAVYRSDHVYYQIAGGQFIQGLCSFLFAANRRFEPSARLLVGHLDELEIKPEEFSGRFDTLVRTDAEITPERRYEIAQLIARSVNYL